MRANYGRHWDNEPNKHADEWLQSQKKRLMIAAGKKKLPKKSEARCS